MISLDQVKQKVDDAFALHIGEKVIIELNGEVRLCMDILTNGGLKLANSCIETLESQASKTDELRIISAAIGTPSESMIQ
jgi:hypothetical protein